MSPAIIDLSPHLTTEQLQKIGPLRMSERACAQLQEFLQSYDVVEFCAPARLGAIVARSVVSFVTSDYFTHSIWFRRQLVHSVCVCVINVGARQSAATLNLTCWGRAGHIVVLPDEHPLPDDYFEQRLIAEVRVENGISDFTNNPNDGSP